MAEDRRIRKSRGGGQVGPLDLARTAHLERQLSGDVFRRVRKRRDRLERNRIASETRLEGLLLDLDRAAPADHSTAELRADVAHVTIVALETAHWKIDEAYDVTKALFSHNPDIGAIFCANDMMAFGAMKYLSHVCSLAAEFLSYSYLQRYSRRNTRIPFGLRH